MTKKNVKFVKKNKIAIAIAVMFLLVGGLVVKADGGSFWDKVALYVAEGLTEKMDVPDDSVEDIKYGAFPGPDVYDEIRVHDTLKANPAFVMELNFRTATSEAGGVTNPHTETLIGYKLIPNDMLCDAAWLDSSTTTDLVGAPNVVGWATINVSTSTSATSSEHAGLISIAELATTSNDIHNKEDDAGEMPDEVWPANAGNYFVAWTTFDDDAGAGGARLASSTAFAGDGNNKGGKVYFNCYYK